MNITQLLAVSAAFVVLFIGLVFCGLVTLTTIRNGDKAAGCITALVAGVCLMLVLVCLYVAMVPATA